MSTTARDGPRKRQEIGRYAFCVLAFLGGAWCLLNTAAMNFSAGKNTAHSELGSYVQPSSTLAIDVMVCVLAAVTFLLLSRGTIKSVISGALMAIVLAGFAGFSVKNTLAFGMQERVERAMVITANENGKQSAAEKQNANVAGRQERHLSWLKAEYAKAPRNSRERRELRAEIDAASVATVPVQVAAVTNVMGDPEAEMLAKKFGWSVEDYVFWNQFALAILLVLGKTFGFGISTAMWPTRPDEPASVQSEAVGTVPAPVEAAERTVPAVEAVNENHPETVDEVASEAVETVPEKKAPVRVAKRVVSVPQVDLPLDLSSIEVPAKTAQNDAPQDLARARRVRAVKRFLDAETVSIGGVTDGMQADELHRAYQLWAELNDPACTMTQTSFGLICSELHVPKGRVGRFVHYALQSAQEVPALKVA